MVEESRGIAKYTGFEPIELPDTNTLKRRMEAVREFQKMTQNLLIENHDFGVIPGTTKPTLLKPGAEKIIKILNLADTYEIISQTEDWDKMFFAYKVRCLLTVFGTDHVMASGLGECNSMEARYRWRWIWPNDIADHLKGNAVFRTVKGGGKQYRVLNDDIATQVNTILKMAKKRAQVDAALSAGRLSDIFTQDIEDLGPIVEGEIQADKERDGALVKTPPPPAEKAHWCEEHRIAFKRHERDGKVWYSHKTPQGWCNEGQEVKSPEEAPETPGAGKGAGQGENGALGASREGERLAGPLGGGATPQQIHAINVMAQKRGMSREKMVERLGKAPEDLTKEEAGNIIKIWS